MRFMMMHKMTDDMEKGLPPDPEIMAGVGALVEDAMKANAFLGGEGLKPSSERTHLKYVNGRRTIAEGPFTDARELVGGFSLMRVRSKDEAIAWVDKLAGALGDVEVFLGPIVEPWDMGFAEKPADAPLRFLAMPRQTETPPDAERAAALDAILTEMRTAGVLETSGGLAREGVRIRLDGGKRTVLDGPFAESRELIAGYAIFELPSKEEAITWAIRFGEIVKVNELDIRPMLG